MILGSYFLDSRVAEEADLKFYCCQLGRIDIGGLFVRLEV